MHPTQLDPTVPNSKSPCITSPDSTILYLAVPELTLPDHAPRWPQSDGTVKTSAAWLMEHAGVSKGESLLGAKISDKHVLALMNAGSATADDILELARGAQAKVKDKFGITLEPEVHFVGLKL